jgi:N-glycosylase/DNA lyase
MGEKMQSTKYHINEDAATEIKKLYHPVQEDIKSRLNEFKEVWEKGNDKDIFTELAFCLLTPQSKAKSCDYAVNILKDKDLLFKGNKTQIGKVLRGCVRFHNTKAKNILSARKEFAKEGSIFIKPAIAQFKDPEEAREWLVSSIKGMGYKEASHFLRNIGMGEDLAILDRHILKNLKLLCVISEIPSSLSRKKYLEIEKQMRTFAENVKIPMSHLDLLLWYKETKEIFK